MGCIFLSFCGVILVAFVWQIILKDIITQEKYISMSSANQRKTWSQVGPGFEPSPLGRKSDAQPLAPSQQGFYIIYLFFLYRPTCIKLKQGSSTLCDTVERLVNFVQTWGSAQHSGRVLAPRPANLGLIPSVPKIFENKENLMSLGFDDSCTAQMVDSAKA